MGGLAKARQVLDLLNQRRAGTTASVVTVCAGGDQLQDARFGAPKEVLSFFVRVARAAFSFHVDTCIFPRDKTGQTMGKPKVNFSQSTAYFNALNNSTFE